MVCLNENITFNKLKLQNNLIKNIINNINRNYYLYNAPGLEKIDEKVRTELSMSIANDVNKIIKDTIKNSFSNDYFIYINMKDDLCTHKFKKGMKEGHLCTKKINTNLPENSKKDFLCVRHSKKHIPKKKNNSKKKLKVLDNSTEINVISSKNNIHGNLHKINKTKLKKKKKNKFIKIFLGNPCDLDFSKIFNMI